jgi:heme/copper-type cytochrome/quinol oxidase subunit 3
MIPYAIERRPDTGVTNVTMGIWLFLASEVMLFGALFSAYALLRTSALTWPHGPSVLSVDAGMDNTVVLIAASLIFWRTRVTTGSTRVWRVVQSTTLAVIFLILKGREYANDVATGLVPGASTFLATYFVLTGLHAIHVAGGIVANTWLAIGARWDRSVGEALTAGRARALSLYWAFVDIVWLVILVLVYLT